KWPVGICKNFLPSMKNSDFSILFVVLFVAITKIVLFCAVGNSILLTNMFGLIIWGIGDTTVQLTDLLFYAIIIQVISSWVAAGHSPLLEVVYHITAALLKPCQRIIPPIGGLDISPILAILALKAFEMI